MKRAAIASAVMLAGLGLAGCASEYGYNRVGYAYDYGGPGYYDGYYGGYGPYYGGYYGWYDGFYYPGAGFYVYDRYRRPYRWDGAQQRYWQGRLNGYRGGAEWRGFAGGATGQPGSGRGYAAQGYRGQGAQAYRGGHALSGGGFHGGGGGHGFHR